MRYRCSKRDYAISRRHWWNIHRSAGKINNRRVSRGTMSLLGTLPTFSGYLVQVRLPAHNRRSGLNVGLPSHSRRSAKRCRRS